MTFSPYDLYHNIFDSIGNLVNQASRIIKKYGVVKSILLRNTNLDTTQFKNNIATSFSNLDYLIKYMHIISILGICQK